MRGYFAIGILGNKTPENLGTLWRSANVYGAAFIFTIGRRYPKQCSDTLATPRHVPLFEYKTFDDLLGNRPYDCPIIGIEQSNSSVSIIDYKHPERAIYLLGAEDNGIPEKVQAKCQAVIHIPLPTCINVAVAGSTVLYDRLSKAISLASPL